MTLYYLATGDVNHRFICSAYKNYRNKKKEEKERKKDEKMPPILLYFHNNKYKRFDIGCINYGK